MSKKMVITLANELNAKLIKSSKEAGVHPLEYIRYLIMKDTKGEVK